MALYLAYDEYIKTIERTWRHELAIRGLPEGYKLSLNVALEVDLYKYEFNLEVNISVSYNKTIQKTLNYNLPKDEKAKEVLRKELYCEGFIWQDLYNKVEEMMFEIMGDFDVNERISN